MAGNTKLIGFGGDGSVTLERWGQKASVVLADDSIQALKDVCYGELPTQTSPAGFGGIKGVYDTNRCSIDIKMDPIWALKLMEFLNQVETDDEHRADLRRIKEELQTARDQQEDWFSFPEDMEDADGEVYDSDDGE